MEWFRIRLLPCGLGTSANVHRRRAMACSAASRLCSRNPSTQKETGFDGRGGPRGGPPGRPSRPTKTRQYQARSFCTTDRITPRTLTCPAPGSGSACRATWLSNSILSPPPTMNARSAARRPASSHSQQTIHIRTQTASPRGATSGVFPRARGHTGVVGSASSPRWCRRPSRDGSPSPC